MQAPPGALAFPPYPWSMAREIRLDYSQLAPEGDGKLKTLTDGSIRIPAVIARTGVQVYTYDDGSEVREYRPPEEVFNPESLETWKALSLTMGHPDNPVDPANWGQVTIGHVSDTVKPDGRFLLTDAIVKDDAAIKAVASGELVELSCGYFADIDPTPGVTPEGEAYDQIQRAIVGNHVALGPKGWGRAGSDVRLLVGDSADVPREVRAVAYLTGMALKTKPNTIKRVRKDEDPKPPVDPEDKDKEATDADTEETPPDSDTKDEGESVSAEEYAKVCAERDALQAQVDALMAASEVAAKTEDSRVAKRVNMRVKAIKADSTVKLVDANGNMLPDRDVMLNVIKSRDPRFDAKGKDEAYLRARFDIACEGFGTPAALPNGKALATVVSSRVDNVDNEGNLAVNARAKMIERNRLMAVKSK